jgi:phosphatidylinositol glycan class A protein
VIPNAVDPSKFLPDPSQRGKDRIKVVVVSRLVYRKGVDLLVGIIPRVCRDLPHVDFIVGGDGSKRLLLQEMVERERLEERVEFLGSVPHAQVRDVLVRGHVFLNCSLTESFCIAILEAAACGLVVVSTCVGGVPEVLPGDMMTLSEPCVSSLVEEVKRAIKRQEGEDAADAWDFHRRIENMYSWTRVAEETACVYEEVMDKKRLTYLERLECYLSLGGLSGLVACLLAMTVEFWICFVEWWQPEDAIDIVPDIFPIKTEIEKEGED